ncbi:MAG: lipocalin-like domain-containing protein [Chloroflexota bacterium]
MKRQIGIIILIALVIVGGAFFGITQSQSASQPAYSADVVSALSGGDTTGYARALKVRDFAFPQDYGAHPDFQTEWWYYTGNLATQDGRRFGFEFTIFRRAIAPTLPARQSLWATNQIYFADFAVSNIGDNQFYSGQQFSRGAVGLAGATLDPRLKVWIENWTMSAQNDDVSVMRLQAADGPMTIDLTTKQLKPPALQGDHGLSAKSPEPGNASYYYSLTRLPTEGTITVNGTPYQVTGNSWLDREWSTSVLSKDAVGWDWFALQLDNQREIMLYVIRKNDGSIESVSRGTLIEADGSTQSIPLDKFKVDSTGKWTSQRTGTTYPSGWHVNIQADSGPIQLDITPLMQDQELNSVTAYWEGASKISGTDNGKPIQGYGYVELTGYNRSPSGESEKTTR